jgi:uncharacterized membrane protein
VNYYFALKIVHIVSATVLFGTGLGIAFFKWVTDRSRDAAAVAVVAEKVVLADWLFTTPAILVQALSGFALARLLHLSVLHGWLACSVLLFCVAGLCWLPVVWLQLRMRDLARGARRAGRTLGPEYWGYAKIWFWLGVPAFSALLVVFWLMVAKPAI